jgi:hypothetical protein
VNLVAYERVLQQCAVCWTARMNSTPKYSWMIIVAFTAILYVFAGLVFGALAHSAASKESPAFWRLSAWFVSAFVFSVQIWYEHFRLRSAVTSTAIHASVAAAIGAFALAVAARIHATTSGLGNQQLFSLALILWPVLTAIPAFLVAMILASVLEKIWPSMKPNEIGNKTDHSPEDS